MNKAFFDFAVDKINNTPATEMLKDLRDQGFKADLILTPETLKTSDRIRVAFGDHKIEGTVIQWIGLNEIRYLSDNGNIFATHYLQITHVNGVQVNESI